MNRSVDGMKMVFLGPPGAGKGTLATLASKNLGLPHISTGDLFRAAIKNETELGKTVKSILAEGRLVPDDLTIALVKERLSLADAGKGWIVDALPGNANEMALASTGVGLRFDMFKHVQGEFDFGIPLLDQGTVRRGENRVDFRIATQF